MGTELEPSVAICVPTYKRPDFLVGLLESIRSLSFEGLKGTLIVADNDPSGSTRAVVEEIASSYPILVRYVVEPERGVAAVRNRLVKESVDLRAEFVAFVDDDMIVDRLWLSSLVRTAVSSGAAAVTARHGPLFDDGVPDWVKRTGFWGSIDSGPPTGYPATRVGIGGKLIRINALQQVSEAPFDLGLGMTGGEDTLLDRQFLQLGLQTVACAEAVTWERISTSRATAGWLIKRGWADGLINARIYQDHHIPAQPKHRFICGAFARLAKHFAMVCTAVPKGRAGIIPRVSNCASALGRIVGLTGLTYEQYRSTHGR